MAENQTLPAFGKRAALLLALAAMTGCSTSGKLAAELQAAAEAEVALPDKVALAPTANPAGAGDETALPISAYAGPTPSGALQAAIVPTGAKVAARSPELDRLIARYADHYELPVALVRRVVKRESNFNPAARNRIYWGLMQIRHDTARTMGYRGSAEGLLDAETNLKYAVKYLRGAYLTAGGDPDLAVRFYASGYYYDAKRKGLLKVTGLRP